MLSLESLEDRLLLSADLIALSRAAPALIADTASGQNSQLSKDGRYLVFESAMDNLAPGDDNRALDVFLFDRLTNQVQLVSGRHAGSGTGNDLSHNARLSADGRFVAYESLATDLTAQTLSFGRRRIFLFDRMTGTSELLLDGNQIRLLGLSGNGETLAAELDGQLRVHHRPTARSRLVSHVHLQPNQPAGGFLTDTVSLDHGGNLLAFSWVGGQLVGTSNTDSANVYLYDRLADQVRLVSHHPGGTAGGNGPSTAARLSADGSSIVFASEASNLVGTPRGNVDRDIYLWDRVADQVQLVSRAQGDGSSANRGSREASISDNGQFITFTSDASDLDNSDLNGANFSDVFLYNKTDQSLRLVAPSLETRDAPVVSGDGRFVAFRSNRGMGTIPAYDAYRFDRLTSQTILVSPDLQGNPVGDRSLGELQLGGDGGIVSYHSAVADVVQRDTNRASDLFVREVGLATTTVASRRHPVLPKLTGVGKSAFRTGELFDSPPKRRVSDDGRFVVFHGDADNLTTNDANLANDVFLYDRQSDQLTLVSRNVQGSGNAPSENATISGDGRFVVFESHAENLVSADGNARVDVLLYEVATRNLRLVSRNRFGTGGGNGHSGEATISGDGRYVVFVSGAEDLVANASGNNVYLYDIQGDNLTLVSRSPGGMGTGTASEPDISDDGRFIIYLDNSAGIGGDTNGTTDVYLFNRMTNALTLVGPPVGSPDGPSREARISGDGQTIVFSSTASNLGGDSNGSISDVFAYDVPSGGLTLVSRNQSGTGSGNGSSSTPRLSRDGRYLVFQSEASNLIANDTNTSTDILVFDRQQDVMTLVSRDLTGIAAQSNRTVSDPTISADGRIVAFSSTAVTLTSDVDRNGNAFDVFVWDRESGRVHLVSRNHLGQGTAEAGSDGTYGLGHIGLSATSNLVVFVSQARDLVQGDYDRTGVGPDESNLVREQDVFARRLNRAPVLTPASFVMPAITNIASVNLGILVRDLLGQAGDPITDADGDPDGIAIFGANNANGVWQFSLDNGQSWSPLGTPTQSSARLLAADGVTRLRFVPNRGFNGTVVPGVTWRAWDQCEGSNGGIADVTFTGGITPFSMVQATATISVSGNGPAPVPNAPTISPIADQVTPEDASTGAISLTIGDVETPADLLTLSVQTSDASLVPLSSITISGIGVTRSLRILPPADVFGDVSLTVTVRDADGLTASTTFRLTITPVDEPPVDPGPGPELPSNPLERYIQCLYQELLQRSPESAGLDYWQRVLQAGVAREQVVAAIRQSPENRGRLVDEYYQRFLDRAADPAGRAYWLEAFRQGATEAQIIEGFFFSPEYQVTHAADLAFVEGLYDDLLGRPADDAGRTYWIAVLRYYQQLGVNGRTAITQGFLNSAEYFRLLLDRYYREILHRPPDEPGLQYWVATLQGGYLNATDVADRFLAADEYFQSC